MNDTLFKLFAWLVFAAVSLVIIGLIGLAWINAGHGVFVKVIFTAMMMAIDHLCYNVAKMVTSEHTTPEQ